MYKALAKANDKLLSFCKCSEKHFATTGQADCPWCGCGWMFSCIECRKAYIFAQVVETEISPTELAQIDFLNQCGEKLPIDHEVLVAHSEWLTEQLKDIPVGTECVIVDGKIIPTDSKDISFSGWFAKHSFVVPPQVAANGSAEKISNVLGRVDYWLERELPESQKS